MNAVRRAEVAGGTYFFTVNLAERKRTLLVDYVDVLRSVMREVKVKHPCHIYAHGDSARSSGRGLDVARWRCGLSDALDAEQGWFLAQHPEG